MARGKSRGPWNGTLNESPRKHEYDEYRETVCEVKEYEHIWGDEWKLVREVNIDKAPEEKQKKKKGIEFHTAVDNNGHKKVSKIVTKIPKTGNLAPLRDKPDSQNNPSKWINSYSVGTEFYHKELGMGRVTERSGDWMKAIFYIGLSKQLNVRDCIRNSLISLSKGESKNKKKNNLPGIYKKAKIGDRLYHRLYGPGILKEISGTVITVAFSKNRKLIFDMAKLAVRKYFVQPQLLPKVPKNSIQKPIPSRPEHISFGNSSKSPPAHKENKITSTINDGKKTINETASTKWKNDKWCVESSESYWSSPAKYKSDKRTRQVIMPTKKRKNR